MTSPGVHDQCTVGQLPVYKYKIKPTKASQVYIFYLHPPIVKKKKKKIHMNVSGLSQEIYKDYQEIQ